MSSKPPFLVQRGQDRRLGRQAGRQQAAGAHARLVCPEDVQAAPAPGAPLPKLGRMVPCRPRRSVLAWWRHWALVSSAGIDARDRALTPNETGDFSERQKVRKEGGPDRPEPPNPPKRNYHATIHAN